MSNECRCLIYSTFIGEPHPHVMSVKVVAAVLVSCLNYVLMSLVISQLLRLKAAMKSIHPSILYLYCFSLWGSGAEVYLNCHWPRGG